MKINLTKSQFNLAIVIFILILIAPIILIFTLSNRTTMPEAGKQGNRSTEECIPTFADGGGPYYLPNQPFRENLAPNDTEGEKLIVSGKLLKNDCKTVIKDGVIDIWQADHTGEYRDEWYRGQIRTNDKGEYEFETVLPKGYGEGTGYRPPHIHFKVFVNGREMITSQMFFDDVKGRESEGFNPAYIMDSETKEEDGEQVHYGYHDIVLP